MARKVWMPVEFDAEKDAYNEVMAGLWATMRSATRQWTGNDDLAVCRLTDAPGVPGEVLDTLRLVLTFAKRDGEDYIDTNAYINGRIDRALAWLEEQGKGE